MNALTLYRIGHFAYKHRIPFIPWFMQKLCIFLFSADISMRCKIGSNVQFGHFGIGLVLNDKVVIEDNVIIYHGVTIGRSRGIIDGPLNDKNLISIEIGENTLIGTGTIILAKEGKFRVGCNCQIGAGVVVTKPIPDNATVYAAKSLTIEANL